MKINSLQRDIALKQGNSGHLSKYKSFREKNGVNNCDRRLEYCGSFTGKESKAAASFLDKILKSKWFGNFAKYSEEHNISTSALIALVLAGVLRPATIMTLPGKKDKDDKIYASGHAMASGIIGFLVSTALTSPFDESIKKIFDEGKFGRKKFKAMTDKIAKLSEQKEAGTISDTAKKELKSLIKKKEAMKTLVKNIPDWVIGVPRAILTIALIPPILKYVFGVEKKKKQQTINPPTMDFVKSNAFEAVKGGVQ